jgi:excisionase family DNA binding protein
MLTSNMEVKGRHFIMVETTNAPKPTIKTGAVYSRQEAAEALGISLSTLKRLIKKGHLRVSKPNGMRRVFITGESILAMLNDTSVEKGA